MSEVSSIEHFILLDKIITHGWFVHDMSLKTHQALKQACSRGGQILMSDDAVSQNLRLVIINIENILDNEGLQEKLVTVVDMYRSLPRQSLG